MCIRRRTNPVLPGILGDGAFAPDSSRHRSEVAQPRRAVDGTNNEFGIENISIVRLAQVLQRDSHQQLYFYDPGVGTLPEPTRLGKWLSKVAGLAFGQGGIARVRASIRATVHTGEPHTAGEAPLLDIDLSILGADEATFDEYDRATRREYDFVPEERYREGRMAVLTSFLRREHLFHTAIFRPLLEARARANLVRTVARLQETQEVTEGCTGASEHYRT
jgi:hypothetical protein